MPVVLEAAGNFEFDKSGGAWLLTYFPPTKVRVGFRLRIADFNMLGEDFTVQCELRPSDRTEFQVAAVFQTAGFDWPRESALCWGTLPTECRQSFLALCMRLGRIMLTVDLASTIDLERYPCEPLSSRDHLFFGSTDDLSMPERRW
jgi:hypothetical protein